MRVVKYHGPTELLKMSQGKKTKASPRGIAMSAVRLLKELGYKFPRTK